MIGLLLSGTLLGLPAPVSAFDVADAFAEPELADRLDDLAMDALRGAGAVVFGTWEAGGSSSGDPILPDHISLEQFEFGEDFVRINQVGDFAGAQGIFQIIQVPGDHNIVYNTLNLSLTVIINGPGGPDLASLLGP